MYSPYIKPKEWQINNAGLELYFGDPAQLIIVTRSRSDWSKVSVNFGLVTRLKIT